MSFSAVKGARYAAFFWAFTVLVLFVSWNSIPFSVDCHHPNFLTLPHLSALYSPLKNVSLTLWLAVVFLLLGHMILDQWGIQANSVLQNHLMAFGIGSGTWMMAFWALGMSGLWYRSVFQGSLILCTGVGFCRYRHAKPLDALRQACRAAERLTFAEGLCIACVVIELGFLGLYALGPEIFYDALVYHLAIPQQWLVAHRMMALPNNCFSGLPMNLEILYGSFQALGGEDGAKLIHYLFGLGSVLGIFGLTRQYASRLASVMACIIFLSVEVTAIEFVRSGVDLSTVFFTVMSIWTMGVVLEESDPAQKRNGLILEGLFCGLAMGTKYTIWYLCPCLIVIHCLAASSKKEALQNISIVAGFSLLMVVPWLVRNLLFYRNPLYPFFHEFFSTPGSDLSNWKMLRSEGARDVRMLFGTWTGFLSYLRHPWDVSVHMPISGNFLGPAYLMGLPLLMGLPVRTPIKDLRRLFILMWLVSTISTFYIRFWLPFLALFAVLIGIGLSEVMILMSERRAWVGLIFILGGVGFVYAVSVVLKTDAWDVVSGAVSREAYLNTPHLSYGAPYFRAAQVVNQVSPPKSKVCVIGDGRTYYFHRPCMSASMYDTHPIFQLSNTSKNGDQLYNQLMSQQVSCILINGAGLYAERSYWRNHFTADGEIVFDDFFKKHLKLIYRDLDPSQGIHQSVFVFALVPVSKQTVLHPMMPDLFLDFLYTHDQ